MAVNGENLVSIHKWLFSVPPPAGRQTQILILEILQCIPVVKIFAFLELESRRGGTYLCIDPSCGYLKKNEHAYLKNRLMQGEN